MKYEERMGTTDAEISRKGREVGAQRDPEAEETKEMERESKISKGGQGKRKKAGERKRRKE